MAATALALEEVDPAIPEAVRLIAALDQELVNRYPNIEIQGIEPLEFRRAGGVFLIGRLDGLAVACGAIRPLDEGAGEVKRMFVCQEHRGNGFARAVLAALERVAIGRAYHTVRLGTGTNQPEAIALYQSAGYYPIPCFGGYASDPDCRCFEKRLPL